MRWLSFNWMLIVTLIAHQKFIRCDNRTIGNSTQSGITCQLDGVNDDTFKVEACDAGTVYLFFRNSSFQTFPHVFEYLTKLESVDISNAGVKQIDSKTFNGANHLKTLEMNMSNMLKLEGHLFMHNANLIALNIANSSITDCDRFAFQGLSNLKRLDLSNNKIVRLTTELFRPLSQLETIRLSNNKIQVITPDLFDHNVHLKWAYFDHNEIIYVKPESFNNCQLKVLDLGSNQLVDIDLKPIKHLQDLTVSNNLLTILNVPRVTEFIHAGNNSIRLINSEEGSQLKKLYLSSNNLANIRNLINFSKLLYLDLSDSHYQRVTFTDLSSLQELKELKLTGNRLSEIQANDVIVNLPKLKMIELSTKHWLDAYVKKLESDLKAHNIDLVQDRATIPEDDFTNVTTIQPTTQSTTTASPSNENEAFTVMLQKLDTVNQRLNDLQSKISSNTLENIRINEQLKKQSESMDEAQRLNEETNSRCKIVEAFVIIMFVAFFIFGIYKVAVPARVCHNVMNYRRTQSFDGLINEQL